MKPAIKVSIVIPCYNHGAFLPEAVASVINLKRDDVELIVVDDGSTDPRTQQEMERLATQAGIQVIRQKNQGLAAARNSAIRVAQGTYILPLDADNRIRAAYLDHGIRILDRQSEIGVVYGDAEYFGERTGRWVVCDFEKEHLLAWNCIDACAVYRRVIWEQNQGYDGKMPVQGLEDWDFWLGAYAHGWQFAYVPEILFDYRVAGESMITRTHGMEPVLEQYIATKHALLFRQAWLQAVADRYSLKAALRKTFKLAQARCAALA